MIRREAYDEFDGEDDRIWVRIERMQDSKWGPFTWYIKIGHGVYSWGPEGGGGWFAWTEDGAKKKARRKVERLRRYLGRQKTITWKEPK